MIKPKIKKVGQEVIKLESLALAKLSKSLGKDFIMAVELISQQSGKIILVKLQHHLLLREYQRYI